MSDELDRLLAALQAQAPERRLDGLEARVWQRIAARTAVASPGLLQWRAAAVGLSLSLGVAFGGAAAAARTEGSGEMAVFSARASLAPSTLLEGRP